MFHGDAEVAAGLPMGSDKSAYLLAFFHFLVEELQIPTSPSVESLIPCRVDHLPGAKTPWKE
jgi:hypothetical protein